MIPLLPNPFNPEDTEFVLDADAFMAALAPAHSSDESRFDRPRRRFLQEDALAQRSRASEANTAAVDQPEASAPRFSPDAAGRRLDTPRPPPMRDEDELFYLAGAEPQSLAPDLPTDLQKRK